jgi:hypothetical protein
VVGEKGIGTFSSVRSTWRHRRESFWAAASAEVIQISQMTADSLLLPR